MLPRRVRLSESATQSIVDVLMDDRVVAERPYLDEAAGDEVYEASPAAYLDAADWFESRRLMVPESPASKLLPAQVRALADLAGAASRDALSVIHMGHRGAVSPIHFDWEFRTVLHLNLLGEKRLVLFAPDDGAGPPSRMNFMSRSFTLVDSAANTDLLRAVRAEVFFLKAGEGVIFPPLWWHAALYDQACLSLSFRFDEQIDRRPLAVLPPSVILQRVAHLLALGGEAAPRAFWADVQDEIIRSFLAPAEGWRCRFERFQRYLTKLEWELRHDLGIPQPAESPPPADLEGAAAAELAFAYERPAEGVQSGGEVQSVVEFLFESHPGGDFRSMPMPLERVQLAEYALDKRRGLPPVRGLLGL